MSSAATVESGHFHAVRFYRDAPELAEMVYRFLGDGLKRDEPAVLIVTAEHAPRLRDRLAAGGIDIHAALSAGLITILDADATLRLFMRDGVPMAQPFAEAIGPVLSAAHARFPGRTIRAYGEMVDVLWKQDLTAAAIRLEALWNDLARSHSFKLLCGYTMGNFYQGSATDDICAVHSHLISETGSYVPLN